MSENRNDNGTFAPAEPLTGQLGVEADQGFRQMPETTPKHEPESSDLETEAANLSIDRVLRDEASPMDEELKYLTPTGETVDEKETIPLDRAAKDLSAYHEAKAEQAIQTASSDLAAQVDQLRAAALRENPALAEHYGVDAADVLAKAQAVENATEQTAKAATTEEPYTSTPGLDPEVAKALQHPQIRQAVEQELTQAYEARESYSQALATANNFAQASFLENFPELASLPPEQIEVGLHLLSQQNPARFNAAINILQKVSAVQTEQHRMQQQHIAAQERQLAEFKSTEDAKFHAMVPDRAKIAEAVPVILEMAAEMGVDEKTLAHYAKTNPIMQHSAFQKMMYDAAQYRLSQKQGSTWKDKAAPASLPPVARPGTRSGVRADSNSSQVAALERQLDGASGNKALKISAQLLALKRTAANR
jgi:hypothetical protein